MPNRLAPTIRASLDKVFRLHNGHGVQISQIRCDNEFRSLFEPIKDDLDVEMEYIIMKMQLRRRLFTKCWFPRC